MAARHLKVNDSCVTKQSLTLFTRYNDICPIKSKGSLKGYCAEILKVKTWEFLWRFFQDSINLHIVFIANIFTFNLPGNCYWRDEFTRFSKFLIYTHFLTSIFYSFLGEMISYYLYRSVFDSKFESCNSKFYFYFWSYVFEILSFNLSGKPVNKKFSHSSKYLFMKFLK